MSLTILLIIVLSADSPISGDDVSLIILMPEYPTNKAMIMPTYPSIFHEKKYDNKALTRRIELISEILKLTDSEYIWRDVTIRFTRNLPADLQEIVNIVNQLRGVVSEKTLLSLLPFVTNPDKELEEVKKEKEENMNLYSFDHGEEDGIEIQNSYLGKLRDE